MLRKKSCSLVPEYMRPGPRQQAESFAFPHSLSHYPLALHPHRRASRSTHAQTQAYGRRHRTTALVRTRSRPLDVGAVPPSPDLRMTCTSAFADGPLQVYRFERDGITICAVRQLVRYRYAVQSAFEATYLHSPMRHVENVFRHDDIVLASQPDAPYQDACTFDP